jgi:GNAT superfamily N-acetyltransferase
MTALVKSALRRLVRRAVRIGDYSIVRARPEHLGEIPNIELAAARLLRGHAPEHVLRETTSDAVLQSALRQGHLWVALSGNTPVGFAHVEAIDTGTAHLEEIDVLPEHGRRGLGTRLVTEVCGWAASAGYDAVTLTTFSDVPWNRPFYERLGFRVVPDADLPAALRVIADDERRRGLDPSRRVVMERPCDPTVAVSDGGLT